MNKEEMLKELEGKAIILRVGEEYFLTERYKELLAGTATVTVVEPAPASSIQKITNYDILNTEVSDTSWPENIAHTSGRVRADHFMEACAIPTNSPDGSYRLRALPIKCLSIIDNIVTSDDINPAVMIEAIKLYYVHTKYPKAFKNLLLEGEVIAIYNEHISGRFLKGDNSSSNQQCL